MSAKAPQRSIDKRAEEAAKRRAEEKADAYDFKVRPERHHERCTFVARGEEACERRYDPLPRGEHVPDRDMYDGTGIGALYGFPNSVQHAWQLAGWNVGRDDNDRTEVRHA